MKESTKENLKAMGWIIIIILLAISIYYIACAIIDSSSEFHHIDYESRPDDEDKIIFEDGIFRKYDLTEKSIYIELSGKMVEIGMSKENLRWLPALEEGRDYNLDIREKTWYSWDFRSGYWKAYTTRTLRGFYDIKEGVILSSKDKTFQYKLKKYEVRIAYISNKEIYYGINREGNKTIEILVIGTVTSDEYYHELDEDYKIILVALTSERRKKLDIRELETDFFWESEYSWCFGEDLEDIDMYIHFYKGYTYHHYIPPKFEGDDC